MAGGHLLRPPPQPPNHNPSFDSQFPPLTPPPPTSNPLVKVPSPTVWSPISTTSAASLVPGSTTSVEVTHSSSDCNTISSFQSGSEQIKTLGQAQCHTSLNNDLNLSVEPTPMETGVHVAPTPCLETISITSNAVIAGLNASLKTPAIPTPTTSNPTNQTSHETLKASQRNIDTWAARVQASTDRSLKNLGSPTLSPSGIPRIKIPDSVFHKGAKIHKDFIIGVFMGKTPSFSHIQSVLTHIWGKGKKLVIHLRHADRSMMVKIPNEYIRKKIVEQEIWHIGKSCFYVAQWSATVALKPPSMESIPLWAHVRDVPFDLFHQQGLSMIASGIGEPVETDEYTIKMVNISVAPLKVKANCPKPLPTYIEIERDDGTVVPINVSYPWTPPTCPCCHQLGHLESHCPSAQWKPVQNENNIPPIQDDIQKPDSQATPPPKEVIYQAATVPSATLNHMSLIPTDPSLSKPPVFSSLHPSIPDPVIFASSHLNPASVETITHVLALPVSTPRAPSPKLRT